ncbi:MAG: hypothetical protein Q4E43_01480 [Akkermansia sp.]|nr:hypothetical protein [Akkermansia sp.]
MSNTDIAIEDVHSTDLDRWADRTEARDELPEIIKRLIYSAGDQIKELDVHSREDNHVPGWDGEVDNTAKHNHIPLGKSYWEIGTNKNAQQKANSDYNKRTKSTDIVIRQKSTYVFVTPRLWEKKEEWVREKQNKNDWNAVKVIDRRELVDWINQEPIVKLNFLKKYLRIEIEGVSDLESKWSMWSNSTTTGMPRYLFNAEIEKHKLKFKKWLASKPEKTFVISADSELEGVAFAKCLLDLKDLYSYRLNSIFFAKEESISSFVLGKRNCIAIVANSDLADVCFANGCSHIVQIITRGMPVDHIDISLGLLDYHSVRLFASENKGKNIEVIARNCGYSRTLIRQELSKSAKAPKWIASDCNIQIVKILSFLGCIGTNEENLEQAVIDLSLGEFKKYADFQKAFANLLQLDETPVWSCKCGVSPKGVCRYIGVQSPMNSIKFAHIEIDKEFIERLDVITKRAFITESNKYSDSTRRHLLNALLICSEYGLIWELSGYEKLIALCKNLTTDVLENCKNNCSLTKNTQYFSYFAELSPDLFIEFIEQNDLSNDINSALADAIHILGKAPAYLKRIILLLGKWHKNCNDEETQDRLEEIANAFLSCAIPQTNADFSQRLDCLNALADICPDLCWEVCIKQFFGGSAVAIVYPGALYRTREFSCHRSGPPSAEEIFKYQQAALGHMLKLCTGVAERTLKVINIIPVTRNELHADIWKRVSQNFALFEKADQGRICGECLDVLDSLLNIYKNNEAYQTGLRFFQTITSDNIFLRNIDLFYIDYTNNDHDLTHIKNLIIECFQNSINIFEYIKKIDKIDMYSLGCVFSEFEDFNFDDFFKSWIKCSDAPVQHLFRFSRGYISNYAERSCIKFLENIFPLLSIEQQAAFALCFNRSALMFSFIENHGTELCKIYWGKIDYLKLDKFDVDEINALSYCIKNHREDLALRSVLYSYKKVPMRLLKIILCLYARSSWCDGSGCYDSDIARLVEYLCANNELNLLGCADIEYRVGLLIHGSRYPYISEYFALHPKHFARVINFLNTESKKLTENQLKIKHLTRLHLLFERLSIPLFCKQMSSWCADVYRLSKSARKDVDYCIGNILVAGPATKISNWMNTDICNCIEKYYTQNLASGFFIAISNSLGCTSRPIDAGGIHEHNLVDYLSDFINTKLASFPRTGEVLSSYVDSLKSQANDEDNSAILMKRA